MFSTTRLHNRVSGASPVNFAASSRADFFDRRARSWQATTGRRLVPSRALFVRSSDLQQNYSRTRAIECFRPARHSRDVSILRSHTTVMSTAMLPRLALRQSRVAIQRRAASTTSEAANAAASGASKAKEAASETAAKAQEGLSWVSSTANSALSSAGSALSSVGGRTGQAITFVQSEQMTRDVRQKMRD